MVTEYREALLKRDKARFARLEAKAPQPASELWSELGLGNWQPDRGITRAEVAAVVDEILAPFDLKAVDHRGRLGH